MHLGTKADDLSCLLFSQQNQGRNEVCGLGVFGQRPIHIEHAHLCAIPKRVRSNQKHESWDDRNEKWETYMERIAQFFRTNNIDNDHKVPT